jgi:hypothetical protein
VPVSCEVSVFGLGAGWILGAALDVEAVAVPHSCVVVDLPWRGRRVGFGVGRGAMEFELFTLFGWRNLATWRNCVFRHGI